MNVARMAGEDVAPQERRVDVEIKISVVAMLSWPSICWMALRLAPLRADATQMSGAVCGAIFSEYSGLGCRPAYDVKHHDAVSLLRGRLRKSMPSSPGVCRSCGRGRRATSVSRLWPRGGDRRSLLPLPTTMKSFGDEDAVDLEVDGLAHARPQELRGSR